MISLRNTFMTVYKGRLYPNYWDMVALCLALGIIIVLAWNAKQMAVPYHLGEVTRISLAPSNLPGYALRTVLRMMIAMFCSLLFTFTFATWAAKSRRAARIIIPLIDILQSVPILGFLSIAIVGFIALFPNSMLGPECAAIFVIFTSQAWNMALGFYQTVKSVPAELKEAADMFHLSAWQIFWRIDVPFSMPGLLWNMMMSMSAGWFFVVASEAVTVSNQQILLPGIGSYIATAIATANVRAIWYAILAMFIVILLYDQILFRPLVAWADKFKAEQVSQDKEINSWASDIFHRTRMLRYFGNWVANFCDAIVNLKIFRSKPQAYTDMVQKLRYEVIVVWASNIILSAALLAAVIYVADFLFHTVPLAALAQVFYLGMITALRVFVCIVVVSLIWVPIGIWIGLRSEVAKYLQPLAQFLAAFPANLLYPLFVLVIIRYRLNVNIWLTPLMVLGSQWYVLFNVIAGASVIPKDLLQVADNLNMPFWLRCRRLLLPAVFPYYITGAITAVGGAWNASIVSEVVSWGNKKLVATGLGAYISEYTDAGDFLHIALGIGMMCILVLFFNRLIWRPLYVLAETRFQMD
jgi:NitT/TauT family transport system permease protein